MTFEEMVREIKEAKDWKWVEYNDDRSMGGYFVDPISYEKWAQLVVAWSRMKAYNELGGVEKIKEIIYKYEGEANVALKTPA